MGLRVGVGVEVEGDVPPPKQLRHHLVHLVGVLRRVDAQLDRLHLYRRAVHVASRHENYFMPPKSEVPGVDVGRQDGAYQVAQVGHRLDVGPRRADDESSHVERNGGVYIISPQ